MKKSSSWRSIALTSLTIAVFGFGVASANGPAHGVWQMVHVGGNDACASYGLAPGCDANFSFSAVKFFDGTTTGQYMDRFAGVNGMHGVIQCLFVNGNRAFVAGTVTSEYPTGEFPQLVTFYAAAEDNGTSRQDPVDRISFTFFDPADAQSICDDVEANWNLTDFIFDNYMFDYPLGQVKIK